MGRYVDLDVAIERTLQDPVGATLAESNNLIGFLECLPIADVMPVVHAHWIDDGYYADFHPHKVYRCSNCDWSKLDVELPEEKYCPKCGAKMDEVVG